MYLTSLRICIISFDPRHPGVGAAVSIARATPLLIAFTAPARESFAAKPGTSWPPSCSHTSRSLRSHGLPTPSLSAFLSSALPHITTVGIVIRGSSSSATESRIRISMLRRYTSGSYTKVDEINTAQRDGGGERGQRQHAHGACARETFLQDSRPGRRQGRCQGPSAAT